LPETVVFVRVIVPEVMEMPPPTDPEELPETVESVSVIAPEVMPIPAPESPAELFEIVDFETETVPEGNLMPPAALPVMIEVSIVRFAEPPETAAELAASVSTRPFRLTGDVVEMEKIPLSPLASMVISGVPSSLLSPSMVTGLLMVSWVPPRVMAPLTLNVIVSSAASALASVIASRRLRPVPPGVPTVAPASLSSASVVTM